MTGGHDLRLLPAAVVVWGASAWLTGRDSTTSVVVAVVAVVVVGLAVTRWRSAALVACCLALVAISIAWRLTVVESSPLRQLAESGRTGTFELDVGRDAVGFTQHGEQQAVVQVVVRRADVAGQRLADVGRATAFLEGDPAELVVGRRFTAVARMAPADATREVAVLDVVRRGGVSSGAPWWEGAERLRQGMRDAAEPRAPRPRALLPALVDGDDARVDPEMETDFRRSGLTHLMAVSGTNLTIVLGVSLAIVRGTGLGRGRRRRWALWVAGGLTVAGFVLMARPDPSVVRAAAMGVVGLAAIGFGRAGGVRALSIAVVALLFLDPWIGRSPGFVLSVCATAGILLLAPLVSRRLQRWLPRWLALAVAVPVAAQVACTPALTAISGQVSIVSVAANVLAAPAVAPATVLGLAGGLLAVPAPAMGQVVARPAGWCASWIIAVAERGAGLDGASVPWTAPWQVMLVLAPLAAAGVLALATRPVVAVGVVAGLLVVMVRPPTPGWPPPGWVMVACDVGQGDATVVRAGPSAAVLVDAGPDPTLVDGCLDRLGVDRLVLAVFTHAHADHIAGWPGARSGRTVDQVAVGPSGGPAGGTLLRAGQRFAAGEVRAEVVWPASTDLVSADADGSILNDASVVLRVQVDGVTLLLTGDVEPDAQQDLLGSGVDLSADVLKMPHHGSARQSPEFFAAVGARVATVSAGADNDYGHPAAAALRLLDDGGARTWRTDLDGDVAVVQRDGRIGVVTRR